MKAVSSKAKFMIALNNSFGSGGMSLAFNDTQFASFIQFLKDHNAVHMSIKVAAYNIGRQPCGKVWVMGEKLQLNSSGEVIDEHHYSYLWLPDIIAEIGNVPTSSLLPSITLPLSTNAVVSLL